MVDAAVDFQIVRRLARQPLHKANDSSLGTQALHLWTALRRPPKYVVLHLVKQESHRYSLGNGHIDLHANNQLAEHMPGGQDPPLQDHMHTHLQHLPPVPRPREPAAWVPDDRIYTDTGRAYHYPQPVRTMAHIRGSQADSALLSRLQHTMRTALYFSALDPSSMRPTGGGIFFERTSVFERRIESSNEDSNWKIVFALIAIQLNPIESKLLGRIAAKAQQQQRAQQIDRQLTQICGTKTQICARKTQICARKKGFWFFRLICCIFKGLTV